MRGECTYRTRVGGGGVRVRSPRTGNGGRRTARPRGQRSADEALGGVPADERVPDQVFGDGGSGEGSDAELQEALAASLVDADSDLQEALAASLVDARVARVGAAGVTWGAAGGCIVGLPT